MPPRLTSENVITAENVRIYCPLDGCELEVETLADVSRMHDLSVTMGSEGTGEGKIADVCFPEEHLNKCECGRRLESRS